MIGVTSLEVYISISIKTEDNNKFELYTFPVSKIGGVTYEKVRDEIEKDLDSSDITDTKIQDEILGPIVIDENREEEAKRMKDGQYMTILGTYVRSVFQDFESFLRTGIDLVADDIKLALQE